MQREIDMSEVSDGKLYKSTDMVKCGTNDCRGCSECCHFVEDTIILDPYDVYELNVATGKSFSELLAEEYIELHLVEGILLPNIKMQKGSKAGLSPATKAGLSPATEAGLSPATETGLSPTTKAGLSPATKAGLSPATGVDRDGHCAFLNSDERCSIHNHRPGFCRLFPLGRIYEDGSFSYFLQVHECSHITGAKVKIKKWLGIPNIYEYEKFVLCWHDHLCDFRKEIEGKEPSETAGLITTFLKHYYEKTYDTGRSFFEQFYERLL